VSAPLRKPSEKDLVKTNQETLSESLKAVIAGKPLTTVQRKMFSILLDIEADKKPSVADVDLYARFMLMYPVEKILVEDYDKNGFVTEAFDTIFTDVNNPLLREKLDWYRREVPIGTIVDAVYEDFMLRHVEGKCLCQRRRKHVTSFLFLCYVGIPCRREFLQAQSDIYGMLNAIVGMPPIAAEIPFIGRPVSRDHEQTEDTTTESNP